MEVNKKMSYDEARAARLRLEVGDTVLVRVTFEETFGWNGRIVREFWKEAKVERATKTTVTADGITFMRECGVERGGECRRMAVVGEKQPNTPEEIEEGKIQERKKLRRRALEVANNIEDAICDRSRIETLAEIQQIGTLLDQLETIIGKSVKKKY